MRGHQITSIRYESETTTDPKATCESLGDAFQKVSSESAYSERFLNHKRQVESNALLIPADSGQHNQKFSRYELDEALEGLKGSSPGPDNIHYAMLSHLPLDGKTVLCMGKVFERMINNRLVHLLETKNLLYNRQYAFRKGRSTTDHLCTLEKIIRDTFNKNKIAQVAFLDISKAYDTTWRRLCLEQLVSNNIGGKMVHYLQEMLRSKNFQVSINGNTSSLKPMETGLCQGSVLSVTMFLLAINTLTSYLPSTVECLIYADDVILIATGENAEQTEGKLQIAFDHLGSWETETGYKISAEKSATVIYRTPRKRKPTTPSKLTLNGASVPRKNQHKCLGVILDQHLKYRAHAEEVKAACQQRVLFIRSIAARTWGGDRNTLLKLYRATLLEKLVYAAPILSAMEDKVHQSLETVHNAGLRAIVGAFRTSPVVSLQAETGIPSLKTLINQRTVVYTSRCLAVDRIEENSEDHNINHLSSDSNSDISSDERWGERSRIQPNSYIDRGSNLIAELELQLPRTTVFKFPECPPWKRLKLNVDKSLHHELSQGSTSNDLRHIFNELRQTKYRIHKAIYTDGSKKDSKCGYGKVCDDFVFQKRMNNISSIFAAESEAIKQALTWIVDQRESRAYLICTDSMSVVTNLEKCKLNSRWKDSVQILFNQIVEMGSEIVICWVPSHIGIPGNERADIEAKKALELPEDENQIIYIKQGNTENHQGTVH
ncbi:uncharacterized protein LOC129742351 [Uranotaenia lowii]|uniref:uncharacterized protein LOC129742351 n=1 Tax=Uranotaenia lowii TaxID=190385 RepID=UPI002479F2FE|nr:uncharacterized protein LOC129742351 [Uranotaenia lowii]